MRTAAAILCALLTAGAAAMLASQQRNPNAGVGVTIQQLTETYYIKDIQNFVGLTDDQFVKILKPLNQYLAERAQIAQRHNRALNQMRQGIQRNASESEIKPFIAEVDKADQERQASIDRFHAAADAVLNVVQQAKLRVFTENVETRLNNMALQAALRARGWTPPANPNPPPAAPAAPSAPSKAPPAR